MGRRRNPWLDAASVLLGMLAALGGAFLSALLPGVASFLVLLILAPLLSSFLVIALLPAASDYGIPTGYALFWVLVGLGLIISGVDRAAPLGPVFLVAGALVWPVSYAGVIAARCIGPQRSRRANRSRPAEPRCPACGYVLYHAENQTCPECGRRFTLREIDTRRTEWKDGVLKPWEPGQTV